MDPQTMLEDNHDDLRAQLAKLATAHGTAAERLFADFKTALSLHTELEQSFIYSHLRQDEATRQDALEALEEHHLIQNLVLEITDFKPKDETWAPKMRLLKRLMEQDIEREERILFPRLANILDDDKCRHVARAMEEQQATLRKQLEILSPTGAEM